MRKDTPIEVLKKEFCWIIMTLFEAIANNDLIAVQTALEQGADVNDCNEDGTPPLRHAIWSECDVELMRLLLDRGADINAPGQDLLHIAIRECSYEIVAFFLEAGADVGFCDENHCDALIAAMNSQAGREGQLIPLIDLLLAYGAPMNGSTRQGESILSIASFRNRFDVVQHMLEAGTSPVPLKWSALMFAVALGTAEDVQREVNAGPDLAVVDCSKWTAWELAMRVGDVKKIEILHLAGCEIEAVGDEGMRPLMHAVVGGHLAVVKWLVENGAELNIRCEHGSTALMRSVNLERIEIVRYLIQAGADIHLTNNLPGDDVDASGWSAIEMAENPEIIRLLIAAGAEWHDLNYDARLRLFGIDDGNWEVECSREEYESGKYMRFGTTNPEKMEELYWRAMVRSGDVADLYVDMSDLPKNDELNQSAREWHYIRWGKSLTPLPNGYFIEIGGRYEGRNEAYDFNEVFVYDGHGNFDIYGYPQEVLPPVVGHTATLIEDQIYIIGGMDDSEESLRNQRFIYRLNCNSMAIDKLETFGENCGLLYGHLVAYHRGQGIAGEIHVKEGYEWCYSADAGKNDWQENTDLLILDLHTLQWRRKNINE